MLFVRERQVGLKPTAKALHAKRKKEDVFIKKAIKRHERPWEVIGMSKAIDRRSRIDSRLEKRGIRVRK